VSAAVDEMVGLLNEALDSGYMAMKLFREMPRGPFFGDFEGGLRGFLMCRFCLFKGAGRLLIPRRAAGRHLRIHRFFATVATPAPKDGG